MTAPDPPTTSLILWRHGNTEWNTQRRVQGHSDTPLSEFGRAQVAASAPLLAARTPHAILSSDLSRCLDAAVALADLTGLPVRQDERLRERHYGEWEGLTDAELAQRFPAARARQRAGDHELGHGIEPAADVMKRMGEALREAADAAPGGTTVVVTHGGSARYALFELLGWPTELLHTVKVLFNCHYSELHLAPERGWVLRAHNLPPGPTALPDHAAVPGHAAVPAHPAASGHTAVPANPAVSGHTAVSGAAIGGHAGGTAGPRGRERQQRPRLREPGAAG